MAMGLVDTMMVGRVSAVDLAAVALGNIFFFAMAIFGMGVLFSIDPIVAQAVGAEDHEAAARGVQRGLVLAFVLSCLTSLLLMSSELVFELARQPTEVSPIAVSYVLVSIPGAFPFMAFIVLRQTLQAMHHVAPVFWTALVANVLNFGLNWVLIWGNLGMPALGAVGSAWATTISRWFVAIGVLVVAWRELGPVLRPIRPEIRRLRPLWNMLWLGIPIGLQFQFEWGAFAVTGLLMGVLGTNEIAAHQIAVNLAAFAFMVPMGIGAAASVRVGNEVGKGRSDRARRATGGAIGLGTVCMVVTGTVFLAFPGPIGRAFTSDPAILAITGALLPIAGVFQLFDGLQVVASGVLRGIGDTRAPMWAGMLGFWVFGFPVSLLLAFRLGMGPAGLWWGLAAGLMGVTVILMARVRYRMATDVQRIIVE